MVVEAITKHRWFWHPWWRWFGWGLRTSTTTVWTSLQHETRICVAFTNVSPVSAISWIVIDTIWWWFRWRQIHSTIHLDLVGMNLFLIQVNTRVKQTNSPNLSKWGPKLWAIDFWRPEMFVRLTLVVTALDKLILTWKSFKHKVIKSWIVIA